MTRLLLVCIALAASGCGAQRHMQYDFGRAFESAISAQGDLTRPSAADAQYPLGGVEAAAIRLLVVESSTNANSGQSQLSNK